VISTNEQYKGHLHFVKNVTRVCPDQRAYMMGRRTQNLLLFVNGGGAANGAGHVIHRTTCFSTFQQQWGGGTLETTHRCMQLRKWTSFEKNETCQKSWCHRDICYCNVQLHWNSTHSRAGVDPSCHNVKHTNDTFM